ncbi:unnamed protein product [Schistosoma margrebowiei]|uniref:Uncharacterized protein n=1 Tax=Schistosoma margrebowiei TaxID=48269 RepID=A0A183LLY2_9TREM|nr:unnamed protein product [Schistosoma margrebowiei]
MEGLGIRRGADIRSDHHLVVTKMKRKLKKRWTTGQTALHTNEFKIALNNMFEALQDVFKREETTMEDNRKGIKKALTSTCH